MINKMEPSFINKVQKRMANTSIGPSTLRGQQKGTIKIAREFLINFDFNIFDESNSANDFLNKLDEQTELLQEKIPSKSWGIARKALNLFLFQSAHDIYLCEKYNLKRLIPSFEVVLDNPNSKRLKKMAKEKKIDLVWRNIKSLTKEENFQIQNFAEQVAAERDYERCYLDLDFWRDF